MMPEQVVGPVALQSGGADIGQSVNEEPRVDQPEFFIPRADASPQRLPFFAKAARMADCECALTRLRDRNDALCVYLVSLTKIATAPLQYDRTIWP